MYEIYHRAALSTERILHNARAALSSYRKSYNIFWNNCETFVTSIVTGEEGFSVQAQRAAKVAIGVGIGAAVVGGLLLLVSSLDEEEENKEEERNPTYQHQY